jgi:8-oxo-dGTP diphosphatase
MNSNERFYVGAYGIYIHEGKLLVIKKARGPYTGMFDLPGGGIEFGEKVEDSVRREFLEETGTRVTNISFLGYNEYVSEYSNEKGEPRKMHHLGLYTVVDLANPSDIKSDPDGEDSLGAVFIDIEKINEHPFSPIALPMVMRAVSRLEN